MTIQVIKYQSTTGDEMILLLDEENDKAESMTKAEYDRRQAEQSTSMVTDEASTL
jgi:hypothetical protein